MPERGKNATNKPKATDASHPSHAAHPSQQEGFIPPHGGYENLLSYQKSQIIYDATVKFCDRFIDRKSRTHDQMVQAARSGNKNIAEGICLIHQANYLLDQQLRQLEKRSEERRVGKECRYRWSQ